MYAEINAICVKVNATKRRGSVYFFNYNNIIISIILL